MKLCCCCLVAVKSVRIHSWGLIDASALSPTIVKSHDNSQEVNDNDSNDGRALRVTTNGVFYARTNHVWKACVKYRQHCGGFLTSEDFAIVECPWKRPWDFFSRPVIVETSAIFWNKPPPPMMANVYISVDTFTAGLLKRPTPVKSTPPFLHVLFSDVLIFVFSICSGIFMGVCDGVANRISKLSNY